METRVGNAAFMPTLYRERVWPVPIGRLTKSKAEKHKEDPGRTGERLRQ